MAKRQTKAQRAAAEQRSAAARRGAETRRVKARAVEAGAAPEEFDAWRRAVEASRGRKLSGRALGREWKAHERDVAAMAKSARSRRRRERKRPRVPDPVSGELDVPGGIHVGEITDASGAAASMGALEDMIAERAQAIYRMGRQGEGVVLVSISGETDKGTELDAESDADVSDRERVITEIMRAVYRALRSGGAGSAGGVGLSAGRPGKGRRPSEFVTRLRVDVRRLSWAGAA